MTPQILCTLFYLENFFTSILIIIRRRLSFSQRKSDIVGDIDLILAPFCSPSWWAVQRHIEYLWRCKFFTPARAKDVRKKALISALSVNLSQKRLDISHMFLVSVCASLRSANDRLVCLWLRCDFSALYNAKILFHTRAYKFCICISCVINNIESKFHLRTTCGRCEMKSYPFSSPPCMQIARSTVKACQGT